MSDYLIRATAADAQIRAFAITGSELVQEARERHNTTPVATAALGRLLMAGAMMGATLKSEKDLLTLRIEGDGELKGLLVTADACGHVKGYAFNPDVSLKLKYPGKLDVGGAVGHGSLQVIKDMGLKEPYVGQTELVNGEIAEDLTYYFASSEQVPSSVGLGVLVDKNTDVSCAGGFIIQLMPFASEEVIARLEDNLSKISSVTSLMEEGLGPKELLGRLLDGLSPVVTDTLPVSFKCSCDRERVSRVLLSVGKKELQSMIDDGKPVTLNCHFCGKSYTFSVEELVQLTEHGKVL